MRYIIALVFLSRYTIALVLLSSCLSPRKAERQLDKVQDKFPEILAEKCLENYPCLPKKADTLITVEYDLIEVECPNGDIPATSRDSVDTVYIIKYNEKRVTKEIRVPCESKVITNYVEDSAKLKVIGSQLAKAEVSYLLMKERAQKFKNYLKYMWLFLALVLIGFYFVSRKKNK